MHLLRAQKNKICMREWGTGYGTRRFVTPTDSVPATRSNVAPEMFRAITRTVLFDHTAASSSMNRVDDASDAIVTLPPVPRSP